MWALWGFHFVRAELQTARELATELLQLVQRVQDPFIVEAYAHWSAGAAAFYLGEPAAARLHLEQGIALYDPCRHGSLTFFYGADSGVFCLSYTAWVLWWLGYPEQALQRSQEALTLARELSHPHSLAIALFYVAGLSHARREVHAVQEWAEAEVALCTEQG